MAQARLTFFSGTGNTRWVVGRLGAGLRDAGYRIDLAEIGRRGDRAHAAGETRPGAQGDQELDVFLFPVYAFALPVIVRRELKKLARVPMKPAAVVSVVGDSYIGAGERRRLMPGYAGGALSEARRILERRGYVVFATRSVGLPASYTQLARAPAGREAEQIVCRAGALVADMAKAFARKEGGHLPFPRLHLLWNLPVRAAFRLLGRRFSGKFFAAGTSCDGCGWCARNCPAATIRMRDGRPRWGWRCESCQRCINGCPQAAIQCSAARTLLLTAATVLPYDRLFHLEGLWGRIGFLGEWGSRAFWTASWLLCALLTVLIVDGALTALARWRPARRVLAAGHTLLYARYPGPVDCPKHKKPQPPMRPDATLKAR